MELDAVLRERRSMRKYQPDRKVSRELVEEILKAATLAPSWKNSQTARYYVVMSDDMLKKVKETCLPAFNQTNSKDAPVLIVAAFVKNRSGYENDGTPSNELGNGWGCYDLGMHNQNLLLKAKDLGLDTLVMGIRDAGKLRELLSIGEDQDVAAVIALGYGAADPQMPKRCTGDCQILLISAEVRHGQDYESIHSGNGCVGCIVRGFLCKDPWVGAGDIPGRQGPGGTLPGYHGIL